jgi:LysR family transcriptional regulator, glycine cleavage system transcriptional activator
MPPELPSLNAVRVFEAAARHGNFSRAAEELHVTQSAVSRQVQRLEVELGERLFVRSGPRLKLTARGQEYLDVVQQGLAVIRRGTSRLFHAGAKPLLTLSALPSLVARWLVQRIADFEQQHPEISIRLSASYGIVDFAVATDIDAAIRFGRGSWPGVQAELILADVIFPVCSPAMAAAFTEPKDLLRERLLVEEPLWDFWNMWTEAAGIESLSQRVSRLSDDFNVQLQAALLGHGVALARGMLVADDLRAGRLVCPFKMPLRAPVQYYFVYPLERRGEPALVAMGDWLRAAAAATVAGMEAYWGTVPDVAPAISTR